MFSRQTLARRLLDTMVPWFLLHAFAMTTILLAIQYFTVSRAVVEDLASLGRTVEPGIAEALWELDSAGLASRAKGIRQNAIVTGIEITSDSGSLVVADGGIPSTSGPDSEFLPAQYRLESVPLFHQHLDGKRQLIGRLNLYSSRDVLWVRIRYSFFAVLLISVIATTSLWVIFSWTIRFRLSENVTQVARIVAGWKFKSGDMPVQKIAYPYHDELGELVHALNESQVHLADSLMKLNEMNLKLEQRVMLRTSELAEREALARALAEEQDLLLRSIQVGVLFTGDGKILRVNPKFVEIFGYTGQAELVGADTKVLFSTDDEFRQFSAKAAPALATGRTFEIEWRGVRRDGGIFIGHTIAQAIAVSGYRYAAIWIVEDISTRKAAEREVAELTAFLQATIDHIPDPIFYKDPDLRFLGCNRANEEAFGVKRADLIGKTVLEVGFLPQSERLRFHEEQKRLLAEGDTLRREVAMPFADGKIHQMLYSASAFRRAGGSPGGLVGVLVDITAQKETEAALAVAKDAAESADRIKSSFLATMSHELRTPLNSIIGFSGILMQGLAGPLNEEQKKQLGMVRDSARHLLALINDVLDISKIEAGELAVAVEPFDLAVSISKVIGIARPLAEKKGLALSVGATSGVGQMVGDARRVEQILLNLLGNAIKFTETGLVTLTVDPVEGYIARGEAAPRPAVRVHVADSGIGIKPEDMDIVFKPFRQVDSTLSRSYEGTGLGLAICNRLAELMGGRIEAKSVWKQGSVFSVTLPLDRGSEKGRP